MMRGDLPRIPDRHVTPAEIRRKALASRTYGLIRADRLDASTHLYDRLQRLTWLAFAADMLAVARKPG